MCGEPFDHTSNLRFLEKVTGVECSNISAWRRKTFGDFTSAFRFRGKPADPATMRDTTAALNLSKYEVANLPKPTAPPTRPRPDEHRAGARSRPDGRIAENQPAREGIPIPPERRILVSVGTAGAANGSPGASSLSDGDSEVAAKASPT